MLNYFLNVTQSLTLPGTTLTNELKPQCQFACSSSEHNADIEKYLLNQHFNAEELFWWECFVLASLLCPCLVGFFTRLHSFLVLIQIILSDIFHQFCPWNRFHIMLSLYYLKELNLKHIARDEL